MLLGLRAPTALQTHSQGMNCDFGGSLRALEGAWAPRHACVSVFRCWFCVCRSHAQAAAPVEVRFPSAHPTHGAHHHANAGTRSPGEEEGSTSSPALRRKAQSLDARIKQLEVRERVLAHKLTEVRSSRCALHVRPWACGPLSRPGGYRIYALCEPSTEGFLLGPLPRLLLFWL